MNKAIIYVGNFLFPDGNASGKRVYGNCCCLKEIGYSVYCLGFNQKEKIQLNKEYDGITYYSIKYVNGIKRLNTIYPYGIFKKIVKEIKKKNHSIEAIIMYGSLSTPKFNMKIIKWCKKNNVKVFYDHVDIFPTPNKKPFLRYLYKKRENYILNKKIYLKCDGIICISSFLSQYHKNKKNVIIPPLVSKVTKSIDFKCDKIKIIYAGTVSDNNRPLSEWKDRIDLIINAVYESYNHIKNDISLTFVGFTKERFIEMLPLELKKEYEKKINVIENIVKFTGMLSSQETIKILRCSDFSVLLRDDKITSKAGFPTKISESVSNGIPVITNDTSDISDYIKDGINGYIINKDELSKKLIYISKLDRNIILQLKKNTFESKVFCYKNFVDKMKFFIENKEN